MPDHFVVIGAQRCGTTYLYRLLLDQGFTGMDIYDVDKRTRCGSRPCAWGFAPSAEYRRLVSRFVDPDMLVLEHNRGIVIDGIAVGADILTVDKPALAKAMLEGVEVHKGAIDLDKYDRVIDATGLERAYLGPTDRPELVADLVQHRVVTSHDLGTWINTSSIGYEWCFPLGHDEFHLGFGTLRPGVESHDILHYLDNIEHAIRCRCTSKLRLSSPYYSTPFTNGDKVVGVGESIGTVAPMGGDGNLYSMQCAELLVDDWDDLDKYTERVLERFDWMRRERLALERLMNGVFPTTGDIRTFLQHSRRAGFGMGPVNAVRFFAKAIQTDRGHVDKLTMKSCATVNK
jgi:flavin-dependent dehydrogenase